MGMSCPCPDERAELIRRLRRMLPHNVQIVLFSATFPDEANQIFLRKEEVTVEAIKQLHLDVEGDEAKYEALSNLYDCLTIGQSIVFCKVCPGVP
jgi:ATP-dependent RNA helicase DDX19/DBP5